VSKEKAKRSRKCIEKKARTFQRKKKSDDAEQERGVAVLVIV
jgi:hypothetical protein